MSVVKRESVMLSWHEVERVVIESVRATGVAIGEGAEMKTHAAGVEVAWTRVEDVSIPRLEEAARAGRKPGDHRVRGCTRWAAIGIGRKPKPEWDADEARLADELYGPKDRPLDATKPLDGASEPVFGEAR